MNLSDVEKLVGEICPACNRTFNAHEYLQSTASRSDICIQYRESLYRQALCVLRDRARDVYANSSYKHARSAARHILGLPVQT